jgi:sulfide:quinone oxidoreductase
MDAVPGMTDNAVTITTLPDAIRAGEQWRRFLDKPGDVVIAASQGAGCFGAAYEFLFNMSYRLRKAGLRSRSRSATSRPNRSSGTSASAGYRTESLLGMFLERAHPAASRRRHDHVAAGALR